LKILRKITALVCLLAAACCLFSACNGDNGNDGGNDVPAISPEPLPEPVRFIYSQTERIGWEKSLENYAKYPDFKGEPAFLIPGLEQNENFIIQGIEYCAALDKTLVCGYIKPETEHPNSVIFVIDMTKTAKTGSGVTYYGVLEKELLLEKADGTAFTGHAGGIAVGKKFVYLANGGKIYYFPLSEITAASATDNVTLDESIKVPVGASYCSYADGTLFVGEFEWGEDYTTAPEHHHPDNSELTAWTVGYELDEEGDSEGAFKYSDGDSVPVPDVVFWHGSKVQGFASTGSKIALSKSYGRKNDSSIVIYDNPIAKAAGAVTAAAAAGTANATASTVTATAARAAETDAAGGEFTVEISGVQVRCYLLTSPERTVTAPPMTEDLSVYEKDGKTYLLVANEASSYNYRHELFNSSKNPADFVWKFDLEA